MTEIAARVRQAWTCRGDQRRAIFRDDRDRQRFLGTVEETRELFGVEVHGYVLMENHVHLILMTPGGNLQKFMERLNTSYTVSFNRRHRRSGHLFQGRYKAILIDADSYLLELSRYLHLNPVTVKRYSQREVQEKMGIIGFYRWSSYRGYVQPRHRERFLTCSPMLEMVGGGRIVTGQQNRRIKDRETAGTITPTSREKRDFHFPNAIPFCYPTDNDFAGDLDKSGARKRR